MVVGIVEVVAVGVMSLVDPAVVAAAAAVRKVFVVLALTVVVVLAEEVVVGARLPLISSSTPYHVGHRLLMLHSSPHLFSHVSWAAESFQGWKIDAFQATVVHTLLRAASVPYK